MLLVATLYYASRPQRSSSRGKIYPCKTQTTDNQISPSGKLGKVCKQVANHTIYNLSTTFMVEVTGLEPAASASRTQRSTKLSHTSLFCFQQPFVSRLLCYYSTKLRKCQEEILQIAKIIRKHNLPLEIHKEMWYNDTRLRVMLQSE